MEIASLVVDFVISNFIWIVGIVTSVVVAIKEHIKNKKLLNNILYNHLYNIWWVKGGFLDGLPLVYTTEELLKIINKLSSELYNQKESERFNIDEVIEELKKTREKRIYRKKKR